MDSNLTIYEEKLTSDPNRKWEFIEKQRFCFTHIYIKHFFLFFFFFFVGQKKRKTIF